MKTKLSCNLVCFNKYISLLLCHSISYSKAWRNTSKNICCSRPGFFFFLRRPSAGVAVVRCLQRAVDRGFLGERWGGKSSDRLGPHHVGQQFQKIILHHRERQWGCSTEVKRERRETNTGRMREEAKKMPGLQGSSVAPAWYMLSWTVVLGPKRSMAA